MINENTIPFSWEEWYPQDTCVNTYNNVVFTDDFGVFKKDEKIKCLTVDYGKGFIESYNEDGSEVDKKQFYKATCIDA